MTTTPNPKRALLLIHAHTYRAQPFLQAAQRAGIQAVMGVDMDKALAEYWDYPLGINFNDTDGATAAIIAYAQDRPLDAIIAVDDKGSLLAAQASLALGLAHNAPAAALAARDKFTMRTALAKAGVPCPKFQRFTTDQDRFAVAQTVDYPCVVKPLTLNGSRGVIRANDAGEFANAVQWVQSILTGDQPDAKPVPYLVEQYIPGVEVAVEGILDRGKLTILALFDKPDPLEGPFFEETLYITPSRLPAGNPGRHRQNHGGRRRGPGLAGRPGPRRAAYQRGRCVDCRGGGPIYRGSLFQDPAIRRGRAPGRADPAPGRGACPSTRGSGWGRLAG